MGYDKTTEGRVTDGKPESYNKESNRATPTSRR